MILVDTSTWVDFLHGRPTRVAAFLLQQRVRTCEVVIGELRLGSGLPAAFLGELLKLPRVPSPDAAETLAFLDRNSQIGGAGIGWADLQVVVAAAKAGALLYSEDTAMRNVWLALGFRLADGGGRT